MLSLALPTQNVSFPNTRNNQTIETSSRNVEIHAHGSRWEAKVITMEHTFCTLLVDGYPPAAIRQPALMTISLNHTSIKVHGKIAAIREMSNSSGFGARIGGLYLDLEFSSKSDFHSFGIPTVPTFDSFIISIHLLSIDTGDELIEFPNNRTPQCESNDRLKRRTTFSLETANSQPISTINPLDPPPIVSKRLECRNKNRDKIVMYHDHSQQPVRACPPVVILAPGYGETKREYLTLAYFLATNGCHVLRYDHTQHVGESDGDHVRTTLGIMKHDMKAVIHFAKITWPGHVVNLVATSLAGRVALKLVGEEGGIDSLVLIAGIIDIQSTLTAVHQEDLVGTYSRGVRRGITNVLGFNVNADVWLQDAIREGYTTLDSTIQDITHVDVPLLWFSGEQDTWVNPKDLEAVCTTGNIQKQKLVMIPEGLHRLLENSRKARAVYRAIVSWCLSPGKGETSDVTIHEPSRRDIGKQNRIERETAKMAPTLPKDSLQEFWRDYLAHFHAISHVGDYRQLLDHVYRQLDLPEGPVRILDAGCGNGNFPAYLAMRLYGQSSRQQIDRPNIQYVGLDFVNDGLRTAQQHFSTLVSLCSSDTENHSRGPRLTSSFLQGNLNARLPFQDGQFDRIVSNLVLGYLENARVTVSDLFRVLAPGGKLILTNLKPNSDLTQVYRNFVQENLDAAKIEEGRRLLNNSAKIRQAESEGLFHFFNCDELRSLLWSCGALNIEVHPTFANQAFIAVATKRRIRRSADRLNRSHPLTELAA